MRNVEEYCKGEQATDDNMAHAHLMLVPKATDTKSEYVILIAFPLQQIVVRTRPNVTLYVHFLFI